MGDRYYIELALPSPLYAPFYLAKQAGLSLIFKYVEFQYAEREERIKKLASSKDSPTSLENGIQPDPLWYKLLSVGESPDYLMAVGDPLRFLSVPAEGYDQPLIVGGLIRRMCFFVIDASRQHESCPLTTTFRSIVGHPRHMTGYKLLRYDLKVRHGVEDSVIEDRIYYEVEPGFERMWYEHFSKRASKAGKDISFAYLTTDPVEARKHLREVKKGYIWDPQYAESMMTALVTGRTNYRKRQAAIDDIIYGVQKAIDMIAGDPGTASRLLSGYEDEMIRFEGREEEGLEQSLQMVMDGGAYYPKVGSADIGQPTLSSHLGRALQIRECQASSPGAIPEHIIEMCKADSNGVGDLVPSALLDVRKLHVDPRTRDTLLARRPAIRVAAWIFGAFGLLLTYFNVNLQGVVRSLPEVWSALVLSAPVAGRVTILAFSGLSALLGVVGDLWSMARGGNESRALVPATTCLLFIIDVAIFIYVMTFKFDLALGGAVTVAVQVAVTYVQFLQGRGTTRSMRRLVMGWWRRRQIRRQLENSRAPI